VTERRPATVSTGSLRDAIASELTVADSRIIAPGAQEDMESHCAGDDGDGQSWCDFAGACVSCGIGMPAMCADVFACVTP